MRRAVYGVAWTKICSNHIYIENIICYDTLGKGRGPKIAKILYEAFV